MRNVFLFTSFFLISLFGYTQENIFINSDAVVNTDSLENWVKQNPAPNITRLRNLLKLEKTYVWTISSKSVLDEIGSLSQKINNQQGRAFYLLGTSIKLNKKNKIEQGRMLFDSSMAILEKINDPTTKVWCYTLCSVMVNNPRRNTDNAASKKIIENTIPYFKKVTNPHDKIVFLMNALNVEIFSKVPNPQKVDSLWKQCAMLIGQLPELGYVRYMTESRQLVRLVGIEKNYPATIQLAEDMLKRFDEMDYFGLSDTYYYLGDAYLNLKMYPNAKQAFQKSLKYNLLIDMSDLYVLPNNSNYFNRITILNKYREVAKLTNDNTLSLALADSLVHYNSLESQEINERAISEIQENYYISKAENDKKIAELEATQKDDENHRLYWYLIIAAVLISAMIFFLYKLYVFNDKLKKLNLFRDQFYTIFTHDIRKSINSLGTVGGMLNQLISQNKTQEINIVSKQIDWMSSKTLNLVDNLLDWGINNGYKVDTTASEMDVIIEINRIMNYFYPAMTTKNIEAKIEIDESLMITTSQNCFEIIFRNMLSNAINHTPNGGKIIVNTKTIEKDSIEVSVENSAGDVTKEKVELINRIFNNKYKPEVGGDGLGLGIILMKTYADKNKSKLSIELTDEDTVIVKFELSSKTLLK
jgi:signal transduction histidine kinase